MLSPQLSNYLKTNRKRLALSQGEVAFLLGHESNAQISRYEGGQRLPSLETALACEVIFRTPLCELFGGLYQKAEIEVAERAKLLAAQIDENGSKENLSKRNLLQSLASIAF